MFNPDGFGGGGGGFGAIMNALNRSRSGLSSLSSPGAMGQPGSGGPSQYMGGQTAMGLWGGGALPWRPPSRARPDIASAGDFWATLLGTRPDGRPLSVGGASPMAAYLPRSQWSALAPGYLSQAGAVAFPYMNVKGNR